jgi:hypothetical protein
MYGKGPMFRSPVVFMPKLSRICMLSSKQPRPAGEAKMVGLCPSQVCNSLNDLLIESEA